MYLRTGFVWFLCGPCPAHFGKTALTALLGDVFHHYKPSPPLECEHLAGRDSMPSNQPGVWHQAERRKQHFETQNFNLRTNMYTWRVFLHWPTATQVINYKDCSPHLVAADFLQSLWPVCLVSKFSLNTLLNLSSHLCPTPQPFVHPFSI